jgi:flagellar hook-associated protein 3 FlgL
MRITGYRMIDLAAASTANAQEAVSNRSTEVSTGLRVAKPSDDPAAWTAAQRAKLQKTLADGTSTTVKASQDRLQETDGALGTLSSVLSQVRSLVVQGSNATYSATDRANLAEQASSLFAMALSAANAKSDNGEYALAGSQSQLTPFAADGTYQGDGGVRELAIGGSASSASTIPGSRLTAAFGVDVLPLLASVATSLQTNDMTALQANLGDLDTAIRQVASSRTVTGDAMSSLQATAAAHDQLSINLTSQISNDVEVDTVAAASDLAKASSVLDASRTVTAHLIQILDPNATVG